MKTIFERAKQVLSGGHGGRDGNSPAPARTARELFAAEAERIVRRMPGVRAVRHVRDAFALEVTHAAGVHTLLLENAFFETRELAPDARAARIRLTASSLTSAPGADAFDDVVARLVPVLRPHSVFADAARAVGERSPLPIVRRPFLPHLAACVAIDDARAFTFANDAELALWGRDANAAFGHALGNLARHDALHGVASYDDEAHFPIFHVAVSDSYESSRLLLPSWLARFEGRVHGRPIAIVPTRDQLIVTGDASFVALERLLATAEREFSVSPRRISPALYGTDDGGRVVPYEAPRSHPLWARTRHAHLKLAMYEYGQQKQALERQLALDGDDVLVGAYSILDHRTEGPFSYATWAEGDRTLLPVTDYVVLGRAGALAPLVVPWGVFREVAGGVFQAEEPCEPARVRTLAWPGRAAMRHLEIHALEL